MADITAKVLIDNISSGGLCGEWGLSVFIEHRGHKILLDTGSSGAFTKNAAALGIDLGDIEYGVLSHAHYDHSDGMGAFFNINRKADFYLRAGSAENCYGGKTFFSRYIGIKKGTLKKYLERIKYVSGDFKLCPGAYLIPHKTPGLKKIGKKANMYRRNGIIFRPDDFSHEQSLVLETEHGLVIFNSCSHSGADNIIREVSDTFPGKKLCAIIGGFHLFASYESEVLAFAARVKNTGIERVFTGHCTGDAAYEILSTELGDRISKLSTGFTIEI